MYSNIFNGKNQLVWYWLDAQKKNDIESFCSAC